MRRELGEDFHPWLDEYEVLGERIQLSDEVIEQVLARDNAMRYAAVKSVSLASFVRDVRQV